LALHTDAAERRGTLARLGRALATRAERAAPAEQAPALALARRVYAVLVRESGDASNRIVLADLDLRAGDAPAARALYEEVLKADAGSAEALRGAARAAAAQGDREHALAYWRSVLDASPPGRPARYEARGPRGAAGSARGRLPRPGRARARARGPRAARSRWPPPARGRCVPDRSTRRARCCCARSRAPVLRPPPSPRRPGRASPPGARARAPG